VSYNNTYLNILASYAWTGKSLQFTNELTNAHNSGEINLMFDSGAFTKFTSNRGYDFVNLDDYSRYIERWGDSCENYIMLDVIGDHQQSKDNYELMVKRGLKPMFVFTTNDDDWSYYRDTLEVNPHVNVSGGAFMKGDWLNKRYQDADMYGEGKAKVHGLAYVKYPTMYQLPLHSVDSSSWSQAPLMFGNCVYFDEGLKTVNYKDILTKKVPMPRKLIEMLEKCKITPKQFSNISNHKGGSNIELLTSIIAHLEYQRYSKRNGLNLFLSIISRKQLKQIQYVNSAINEGTLTYENYKKITV